MVGLCQEAEYVAVKRCKAWERCRNSSSRKLGLEKNLKNWFFSIENANFANFAKCQNLSGVSVEVAGWNIGPPGWVEAMQGVGQLTVTPTSRYSRYKTQLSEILTDLTKKKPSVDRLLRWSQDVEGPEGPLWAISCHQKCTLVFCFCFADNSHHVGCRCRK